LPNSTFSAQEGLVATSQAFRSVSLGGMVRPLRGSRRRSQIEGEHQCGTVCRRGAVDEFLIEAAITHQILLKPKWLLGGLSNIFNRTNRHGAQAKRDAAGSGRPRAENFAVGMKQSREARRAYG